MIKTKVQTKPLCHKQQTEITDACLDCDLHLECFPMDEETEELML